MDMVFSVQTSDTYTRPVTSNSLARAQNKPNHLPAAPTEFRTIIAIPASIQSRRLVCVHPSNDYDGEVCHWLSYVDRPLQEYRIGTERWQAGHTECVGCNERGMESFLASFDPRRWLDGLNTPTEIVACAVEVVTVALAVLAIALVCMRCIWPMARCVGKTLRPPTKKK